MLSSISMVSSINEFVLKMLAIVAVQETNQDGDKVGSLFWMCLQSVNLKRNDSVISLKFDCTLV